MCFGINATQMNVTCEEPSVAAICAAIDDIKKNYMGGVRKKFINKGKILIDLINDLRIGVGQLLRRFYHHNSCLPNKLVLYEIGPDEQSL
jgi:hypothetical protein